MTSPSSSFRPKLTDKEYLEIVFENGQILAKSQRSNVFSMQNQRTKSIMDLYEAEYNEDFKKSIHDGGGSIKNLGDTQVVPPVAAYDETNILQRNNKHVDEPTLIHTLKASSSKKMVVDCENRKNIEFIPPDEQSVVPEKPIELSSESTDYTGDSEGSTYISSSLDDDSDDTRPRFPARTRKPLVKRRRSKELCNSPDTKQRNDINKKMRTLQDLLPNPHKDDNESLLDEAINYMTTLQLQVQMMTMNNRFVTPAMMLPLVPHYSQMNLATGMQMGVPQFQPAPVLGAGLPVISNSAYMLRFPLLMPIQNSALFSPTDNCFLQSVPPLCGAFPNQIPKSTSLSNLDDPRTDGEIHSGKRKKLK